MKLFALAALPLLALAPHRAASVEDVVELFPDGTVHLRYELDSVGRLHGPYVEYFEGGQLALKTRYKRGRLDGTYESYHAGGRRFITTVYDYGVLDGKYDENWTDGTPRVAEQQELFQRSGPLADLNALYYTPWDVAADGRFIMTRSVTNGDAPAARLVVVENWLEEVRGMLRP